MTLEVSEYILASSGNFLDDTVTTRNIQVGLTQDDDTQDVQQWRLSGFDSNPSPGVKGLIADLGSGYRISIAEKDGLTDSALLPGERKIYSDLLGVEAASIKLENTGKVAIGAKNLPFISTPPAATGLELLELVDRILTVLGGVTNLAGTASGASFLPTVITELGKIQTDLGNIKGSF